MKEGGVVRGATEEGSRRNSVPLLRRREPGIVAGDERELEAQLRRVEEAGVTDLVAVLLETDPGARERTLAFLGSLL